MLTELVVEEPGGRLAVLQQRPAEVLWALAGDLLKPSREMKFVTKPKLFCEFLVRKLLFVNQLAGKIDGNPGLVVCG